MYRFILVFVLCVTSEVVCDDVIIPGSLQLCSSAVNVPTRISQATNVFEGWAERILDTHSSWEQDVSQYIVVFRVRVVYKGTLDQRDSKQNTHTNISSKLVSVGFFGNHLKGVNKCNVNVAMGSVYVLFVGDLSWSESESGERPVPLFKMAGLPELASDGIRKQIRQTLEDNGETVCVGCPRVIISPERLVVNNRRRLQLNCRVVGPAVTSNVTWYKDGRRLDDSKVVLKESRRGSRLSIARADSSHSGQYQCLAVSHAGESALSARSSVSVSDGTSERPLNPHTKLCGKQSYCLNDGVCYILTTLNIKFCICAKSYQGERCAERHTGVLEVAAQPARGLIPEALRDLLRLG